MKHDNFYIKVEASNVEHNEQKIEINCSGCNKQLEKMEKQLDEMKHILVSLQVNSKISHHRASFVASLCSASESASAEPKTLKSNNNKTIYTR